MSADKDILDKLDETLNSIQSHRDWRAEKAAEEERKLNQAWNTLLDQAQKLRSKLRGHERLRYFTVSRDQTEIALSFHSSGNRADSVSFYRRHPEGKFDTVNAIWCVRPGEGDRRFQSAEDAVDVLVRYVAAHLSRG